MTSARSSPYPDQASFCWLCNIRTKQKDPFCLQCEDDLYRVPAHDSWGEPAGRSTANPESGYTCWFCSGYPNKEDHLRCDGGCGYEFCRTCWEEGGRLIGLERVGGKRLCTDCAAKHWAECSSPAHAAKSSADQCSYCLKAGLRLKPCAGCFRKACRKDSFWCQKCPHYICRHCQEAGVIHVRQSRGRWTCADCHEGP